ncbi:MAG: LacI family transcriptional regulator [Roseburia sp.]|jgi:LacI family transcriptional regulator|nr:LacI family transcriptional regulator [Roseburia sp.]
MEEKINIKQIAELAGVSVATVSHVMNQNGRFSAETERRVKDVIEKYRYIPNTVAKGLRTNRMQVIGIIVPDIVNNYFARLVRKTEKLFFERGYSTVICNTDESRELEQRHVQTLISQQVTGIIFISGRYCYEAGGRLPMIYVDRRPEGFAESGDMIVIESDNEEGGYLSAESLLRGGCRRLAVLLASGLDYNHKARLAGCERALRDYGVSLLPGQVMDVAENSFGAAREAIKKAIDTGLEFDALMCTTDELAIGAILGLRERGRSVPGDVRITGFDDTAMAAAYNPPISSIHQNVDRMAACSVDAMLELVENGRTEKTYQKLPVHLVERESSGISAETSECTGSFRMEI